jgi:hypothetical protein
MRRVFGGLRVPTGVLLAGLLASVSAGSSRGGAEEVAPPDGEASESAEGGGLEEAIDKAVEIELLTGTSYPQAVLLRVVTGGNGEVESLRVRLESGRSRSIRLGAIAVVKFEGRELYRSTEQTSTKPKSKKELKAEEDAAQKAKEHEAWLARLTARGIRPWEPITSEEHAAMIAKHKQRFDEAVKLFPDLYMVETDRYLFCSNMPRHLAGMYVGYLDEMYKWMCKAYGLDEKASVWCGKASIFAFNTKEEYAKFEEAFMNQPDIGGSMGRCHSMHDRSTTISCFIGQDPHYFGAVLVHETSHGFLYCYKTPVNLPSWVNEGMAENIAMMMVTKDKGVKGKIDRFVDELRKSPDPRLGDDFFVLGQNIDLRYYGGASSMVRFMMVTDQKKFVRYVDLLKEGTPWEEALEQCYNAKKEQLVTGYGRWIGVPGLKL